MTRSEQAFVQAKSNVQNQDILSITIPMINRMTVANVMIQEKEIAT